MLFWIFSIPTMLSEHSASTTVTKSFPPFVHSESTPWQAVESDLGTLGPFSSAAAVALQRQRMHPSACRPPRALPQPAPPRRSSAAAGAPRREGTAGTLPLAVPRVAALRFPVDLRVLTRSLAPLPCWSVTNGEPHEVFAGVLAAE